MPRDKNPQAKLARKGRVSSIGGKLVNVWGRRGGEFASGLATKETKEYLVVYDNYSDSFRSVRKPFDYEILGDSSGRVLGVP
jgi:hypothetical protein